MFQAHQGQKWFSQMHQCKQLDTQELMGQMIFFALDRHVQIVTDIWLTQKRNGHFTRVPGHLTTFRMTFAMEIFPKQFNTFAHHATTKVQQKIAMIGIK